MGRSKPPGVLSYAPARAVSLDASVDVAILIVGVVQLTFFAWGIRQNWNLGQHEHSWLRHVRVGQWLNAERTQWCAYGAESLVLVAAAAAQLSGRQRPKLYAVGICFWVVSLVVFAVGEALTATWPGERRWHRATEHNMATSGSLGWNVATVLLLWSVGNLATLAALARVAQRWIERRRETASGGGVTRNYDG